MILESRSSGFLSVAIARGNYTMGSLNSSVFFLAVPHCFFFSTGFFLLLEILKFTHSMVVLVGTPKVS